MKKIAVLMILLVACSAIVVAQEIDDSNLPKPSVLPGDTLYGLKLAWENARQSFKFSSKSRAEYALQRAMTRVAEAKILRERNLPDLASEAEQRGIMALQTAQKHIDQVDEGVLKELQVKASKNVETIQGLIAKRALANETQGLKGLQTAMEQFQKNAERKDNVQNKGVV